MAKTKTEKPVTPHHDVVEERSGLERFIEDNSKVLMGIGGVVLAGILGFLAYQQFILKPAQEEAQSGIFVAQDYFASDSLDLALNGDGQHLGFIDIADEYGNTKTGNLASYYAGIIYMRKGQYDAAIDYLSDFDPESEILTAFKHGLIGDAQVQLGNYEKAASSFQKAANVDENEYTAPMFLKKLGLVKEKMDEPAEALKAYEKIKEKYPESTEAGEMEKYIARMEAQLFVQKK